MKRGNQLSKAARFAKTRREQEEARKEREKHFPKPLLVPEIGQSNKEEDNESRKLRRTLAAAGDGSHVRPQLPHALRWHIPGLVPASSGANVISFVLTR